MRKVLILGGDAGAVLFTIVRSLGRQGIEVHSAWGRPAAIAHRSRYLTRTWDLSPYDPGDDRWKPALIDLVAGERFDLVIPCDDPSLLPLQAHRAELEGHGRFCPLDDSAFEATSSKAKTYELAVELGLPVPRQARIEDLAEIARRPSVLTFRSS